MSSVWPVWISSALTRQHYCDELIWVTLRKDNLQWHAPCHYRIGLTTGSLIRYVQLPVAHALVMLGAFSPPPISKKTASWRSRHASRHERHARAVMHVGVANPWWRGKRSQHIGQETYAYGAISPKINGNQGNYGKGIVQKPSYEEVIHFGSIYMQYDLLIARALLD